MQHLSNKQTSPSTKAGLWHIVGCLTPEQTSDEVAQALPEMVNQATPQGQVPQQDPFAKGMDSIKRMLKI